MAVVGSRTPTPYGLDAADAIATALARSSTVLWSGLARGIDRVAHECCLQHDTPTVAVLAGLPSRVLSATRPFSLLTSCQK